MSEEDLINGCRKGNSSSQRLLFERFAGKMLAICLRYSRDRMEAEDHLMEGFMKAFDGLKHFRGGSLEGWLKRIFVNHSISAFRKSKKGPHWISNDDLTEPYLPDGEVQIWESFWSAEELVACIQSLPEGARMVFNLHELEGYSHKEISQMLEIAESNSRAQLARARLTLQKKIKDTKCDGKL